MADGKESKSVSVPLSQCDIDRDAAHGSGRHPDPEDPAKSPPNSPNSSPRPACCYVLQSWISRKFMTGCVVLFPVALTLFVTWWFIQFVDGFFSPIYARLGIDFFGLGFITSLVFIFVIGIFVSSWLGATVLWSGEWLIKRMPFVKHIYSASKQISAAVSPAISFVLGLLFGVDLKSYIPPSSNIVLKGWISIIIICLCYNTDQNTTAFKEVAIICHPRVGEYAFGFITSTVILQNDNEDEELCSVYVPTNHLYIGDIFLINSKEIIRPNLSIREGIEIIVSGGMTMPQLISPQERITRKGGAVALSHIIQS